MNTIINNRIKTLVGLVLGITTLFGLLAFATPVAAMTCNSATITGTVNVGTPPTNARFSYASSYNTVANGGGTHTPVRTFNNSGNYPIEEYISGLTENTTYFYRTEATNSFGTSYGAINNFTTPSCGGGNPPPTSLSCSLDYGATPTPHKINQGVKFEVFGGNGSYNWITDGGNSDFESGSSRMRNWINWSSAGKKYVKVESGGQTVNCGSANVIDDTPQPPQTYTVTASAINGYVDTPPASSQQIASGSTATFHFNSNNLGTPTRGGSCPSGSSPSYDSVNGYWFYTTGAIYNNCNVTMTFPNAPTDLSCALDYGATPTPHKIDKGVKFEAFGGGGSYSWTTDGGTSNFESGSNKMRNWIRWSTPGKKYVTVFSSGQTANCTTATIVDDTPQPPQTYTVTASAGQGGSISPGSRTVSAGNTTTFTATAYSGYYISSVSGCSGNLNGNTYVTGPINSNCHVYANFTQNQSQTYTVTASAGQGGSISPSTRTVNAGNTASFTVTPSSGYTISSVSGCSGDLSGSTYVTGPIYSNCHVYANFTQNQSQTYTVTASAGQGGSISPGSRTVNAGNTTTFNVTAYSGYSIGSISGSCGGNLNGNTFVTAPVYSNCHVYANFDLNNDDGEGPDVTTEDATDVDEEDAVLNGWVNGNGLSVRAWFEYGTSVSNLNRSTSSNSYGSGSTNFNARIDDLNDDTTYYFRAVAENSEGTDRGSILSFRTDEEDDDNDNDREPEVTTRNATNVSSSEATLNGRVDGNGRTTRAWFEYGTSSSLGHSTARTSYGSGSTNYDRTITGLMPNTTYYFRAMAENSEGTDRGSILSFYTTGGYIPPVNNQPTVVIYADSTNLAYNGSTTVRWSAVNATSCIASGGSVGWAGIKSMGPGSFYTGSLTSARTYTISCSNNYGSSTDSVTVRVRGQVINDPVIPTSYVIINSSVDRNQPIVPTIDNTRPHPGDEINYTVTYQNVGNASITGLTLRLDLPYEVDYMFSNPSNPTRSGNTLIFSLGTLRANAQGTVTVRVRVRDNIPAGTYLNFPAVLSYVDPSGHMQSVNANVSAQIWSEPIKEEVVQLGANVFGAGFFPTNIFGWLLLIVLILLLVYLAKYIFGQPGPLLAPFSKKTTTTTIQH